MATTQRPELPIQITPLRDDQAAAYGAEDIRAASGLIQLAVSFCAEPETSAVFYDWLLGRGMIAGEKQDFARLLAIAEDWSTRMNRMSEWLGL